MLRDIEVHNPATVMCEDHQNEQHLVSRGWHHEETRERIMVDTSSNSAQTMGFMVLDPNNDRGHQIGGAYETGQEYQAVRIFGKDNCGIRI